MMQVRSSVKYSPIHGLGCFADEDIKKGQVVWEFDSRLDQVIDAKDLDKFPAPVVEFLRMYCYGQQDGAKRTMILCGDHARHMNHSDAPNLLEADGPNGVNIAGRDIKKGEELTCDYGLFDLDADYKLKK
jgi:SET domain-containing protein